MSSSTAAGTEPDDVGSETRVVKLTEIQRVGRPRAGMLPVVVVAIVGVAILAFSIGAAQHPTPRASPTSPVAAVESPAPSSTASTTPPRPTPTRVLVVPTPRPSNAYPWTWARMDLEFDLGAQPPENMWALGDHVVLLGWTDDGPDRSLYHMASINSGFGWDYYGVPAAIAELTGASVIGDRMWFVARVTGVSAADASWQLVGTRTGETWESLGPTDGLGLVTEPNTGSGAGFVGRVGDVWVATTFENEGPTHVHWSSDGRQWQPATLPGLAGQVEIYQAAMFRDRMLVLGWSYEDMEHIQYFVLTSTDGATWTRAAMDLSTGRSISNLTCNLDACVIAEETFDGEGTTAHVWTTSDGESWSRSAVDLPMAPPGSSLRLVRATDSGFIAVPGYADAVLLSDDGRSWRVVQGIKPAIAHEDLMNLAVAGDLVVGYGQAPSSDLSDALWRGSLVGMELSFP